MDTLDILLKALSTFIIMMLFCLSIIGLAVFVQQSETPPSVWIYASVGAGFTTWLIYGIRGIWLP